MGRSFSCPRCAIKGGAHFQAEHLIHFVLLHGQHQDRQAHTQLAHLAAEIEARAIRQANIQDDQLWRGFLGEADSLHTAGFPGHVVPFALQAFLQAAGYGRIIFDEQNGGVLHN